MANQAHQAFRRRYCPRHTHLYLLPISSYDYRMRLSCDVHLNMTSLVGMTFALLFYSGVPHAYLYNNIMYGIAHCVLQGFTGRIF